MKLLISPAKRMRTDGDFLAWRDLPCFIEQAERLRDYLHGLDYGQLKKLLACNDQIAALNYERYRDMDLRRGLLPALTAYDGIQYQYMASHLFTAPQYEYLQAHLRILSGLYGVLRPLDGVTPYRLEFGARLKTGFCKNLYDYWGDSLCRALLEDGTRVLVNLASEEYAKAVRPYVPGGVRFLTAVFGEEVGGKVVEKGVYVKMVRGEMVRFLAEQGADSPETMRSFNRLGYRFCPDRSDGDTLVFLRAPHG